MKRKTQSGVQAFLIASGILENGSKEDIEKLKRQYWSMQKSEWKRQKRKKEHSFTVSYTDGELRILAGGAKKHKLSRTAFIKEASLAYPSLRYIVMDTEMVGQVIQALYKNYTVLQALTEQDMLSEEVTHQVILRLEVLESMIISQLVNPQISSSDHKEPIEEI